MANRDTVDACHGDTYKQVRAKRLADGRSDAVGIIGRKAPAVGNIFELVAARASDLPQSEVHQRPGYAGL